MLRSGDHQGIVQKNIGFFQLTLFQFCFNVEGKGLACLVALRGRTQFDSSDRFGRSFGFPCTGADENQRKEEHNDGKRDILHGYRNYHFCKSKKN